MITTQCLHIDDADKVHVEMDALGYFEIIITDGISGKVRLYVKPHKLTSILDLCQTALTQRMKDTIHDAPIAAE